MARPEHFSKSSSMMTLASIAVVIAALYLAKGVLIPLALAGLLSFLLIPVCDWLERQGLGRIPAVAVTAIMAFALVGIAAWAAATQVADLGANLPQYRSNIQAKMLAVNDSITATLGKFTKTAMEIDHGLAQAEQAKGKLQPEPAGQEEKPLAVRVVPSPPSSRQVMVAMFGTALEVLGSTGIVVVFVVFFLLQREDLRDRFIRLIGKGQEAATIQALEDAATRVSRYLFMQLIVNVTYGIPVAIGLYFIGVPNAILWGIVAAVLRFIPYIGPWIAAVMPIALSLTISQGWVAPMLTVGLFVVLELLSNNVMEPWLYGKNTGISPVAVLVAAVFWTWLWGAVGLLLSTPLTVCLLVIGKHVPQLSFLNTLLGDEPVFDPKTRVYQRLVAGDHEEAVELIEGYLQHMPLTEVYDTVLIPAMVLTQTDWHRGELDEDRRKLIFQGLREMIEELGERQQEIQAKQIIDRAKEAGAAPGPVAVPSPVKLRVLCLPARGEADEIVALMLDQLLEAGGCLVQTASAAVLSGEMVGLVEQHQADVVCVSAMPPAAAMHARHLCNRLRAQFPEQRLIVGLWSAIGDINNTQVRIDSSPTVRLAVTLKEAQEQARLLQPLLLERDKHAPAHAGQVVMEAT